MNPGIFYLYEYNNTQKLRNTGFLKITCFYHSCTLQLNARGIPVSYADPIKLYVFYVENRQEKAAFLTEITCANHALSARMTLAESDFPDGHSLEQLEGFFLLLPNGHLLVAAIPGIVIDTQKLLSASDRSSEENVNESTSEDTSSEENVNESTSEDTSSEENVNESTSEDTSTNKSSDRAEPEAEMNAPSHINTNEKPDNNFTAETTITLEAESICDCGTEKPSAEPESHVGQSLSTESDSHMELCPSTEPDSHIEPSSSTESDSCIEPKPQENPGTFEESNSPVEPEPQAGENASPEKCTPQQSVKKIQRSELSVLPRRYWHLANNSFLLHGYHNYKHLILVEKDGHYWLGVPGIYDPREARAARLFGFPQFTDSYNTSLQLSDDECSPEEKFGYWCCYLK